MDGFAADLEALEYGINKVVQPTIDHSEMILGKLHLLERGEAARMVGRGGLPATQVLNAMCGAYASGYLHVTMEIIVKHKEFGMTLEAFRDTLKQVLDSYQKNEARQEDNFRTILRDI